MLGERNLRLKNENESEMEVKASLKYAKIGTLKSFPVINFIRGKSVNEVVRILSVQSNKASKLIHKLVQSALANAEQKKVIDVDRLYVKKIYINQGPFRRSFIPRARGRASSLIKKTSHIYVVLDEK